MGQPSPSLPERNDVASDRLGIGAGGIAHADCQQLAGSAKPMHAIIGDDPACERVALVSECGRLIQPESGGFVVNTVGGHDDEAKDLGRSPDQRKVIFNRNVRERVAVSFHRDAIAPANEYRLFRSHTPLPTPAQNTAERLRLQPFRSDRPLIQNNEPAFTMPVSVAAWPGLGRAFGVAEGVA